MAESSGRDMKFDYDEKADVIYVSFGTGEPSYSEEIDDQLIVDFGIYTGAPTGFQLLNVKKDDIGSIQVVLKRNFRKVAAREKQTFKAVRSEREQLMRKALEALPSRLAQLV
jgi:hypothetical protein